MTMRQLTERAGIAFGRSSKGRSDLAVARPTKEGGKENVGCQLSCWYVKPILFLFIVDNIITDVWLLSLLLVYDPSLFPICCPADAKGYLYLRKSDSSDFTKGWERRWCMLQVCSSWLSEAFISTVLYYCTKLRSYGSCVVATKEVDAYICTTLL